MNDTAAASFGVLTTTINCRIWDLDLNELLSQYQLPRSLTNDLLTDY
jgi:hypothetical protein